MLTHLAHRAACVHPSPAAALQLLPWTDLLQRGPRLPTPVDDRGLAEWDDVAITQRRLHAGGAVFFQGQPCTRLHAVRAGSFKISVVVGDGREQVCQFCFAGDLMGLDGLGGEVHASTATALEDSIVESVPFASARDAGLRSRWHEGLFGRMGQELVREHARTMLLASTGAVARVATFLLEVSVRMQARGGSPVDFQLRMYRGDIGSYLGLRLETVSRILSALQQQGVLRVNRRHIVIRSLGQLRDLRDRNSD